MVPAGGWAVRVRGVRIVQARGVAVHLIDGTQELFRDHFALPKRVGASAAEVAPASGVLAGEEGSAGVGQDIENGG